LDDRRPADIRAHVADSRSDEPYRPHLPPPRSYWAYAVTGAELVGPPTNPRDGEHVVEVVAVSAVEAADLVEFQHADVKRLAMAMALV
jgi:8-oxo-dGTP diphosphatase